MDIQINLHECVLQECNIDVRFSDIYGKDWWIQYFNNILSGNKETEHIAYALLGSAGSGKSALASAVLGEAGDRGYKCFELYATGFAGLKPEQFGDCLSTASQKILGEKVAIVIHALDEFENGTQICIMDYFIAQFIQNIPQTLLLTVTTDWSRFPKQLKKWFQPCPIVEIDENEIFSILSQLIKPLIINEELFMNPKKSQKVIEIMNGLSFEQLKLMAHLLKWKVEKVEQRGDFRIDLTDIEMVMPMVRVMNRSSQINIENDSIRYIPVPGEQKTGELTKDPTANRNASLSDSISNLDTQDVAEKMQRGLQIVSEGDPSEEALVEELKQNGQFTEEILIDLGEFAE